MHHHLLPSRPICVRSRPSRPGLATSPASPFSPSLPSRPRLVANCQSLLCAGCGFGILLCHEHAAIIGRRIALQIFSMPPDAAIDDQWRDERECFFVVAAHKIERECFLAIIFDAEIFKAEPVAAVLARLTCSPSLPSRPTTMPISLVLPFDSVTIRWPLRSMTRVEHFRHHFLPSRPGSRYCLAISWRPFLSVLAIFAIGWRRQIVNGLVDHARNALPIIGGVV